MPNVRLTSQSGVPNPATNSSSVKPRDTRLEWLLLAVVVVIAMHHLPSCGFIAYPLMLLDTWPGSLTDRPDGGRQVRLAGPVHRRLGSGRLPHSGRLAPGPGMGGLLGPCVAAFVPLVLGRWQRGARFWWRAGSACS